jgi:hypothetical protein
MSMKFQLDNRSFVITALTIVPTRETGMSSTNALQKSFPKECFMFLILWLARTR